jgi:corin
VAVSVTEVPEAIDALHVAPQLMPDDAEATVPWPVLVTVKVKVPEVPLLLPLVVLPVLLPVVLLPLEVLPVLLPVVLLPLVVLPVLLPVVLLPLVLLPLVLLPLVLVPLPLLPLELVLLALVLPLSPPPPQAVSAAKPKKERTIARRKKLWVANAMARLPRWYGRFGAADLTRYAEFTNKFHAPVPLRLDVMR